MGQPAARTTDMHVCPLVTGVVPHVGGPVIAPCEPTVLIGGLPAARVSDMLVCVGPPDVIAQGSPTVLIGGLMAARMGDMCVHGGAIILGEPTVLIGDGGGDSSAGGGETGGDEDGQEDADDGAEAGGPADDLLSQLLNGLSQAAQNLFHALQSAYEDRLPIHDLPEAPSNGTPLRGQEKDDTCALAATSMAIQIATGQYVPESALVTQSHTEPRGYENGPYKGTYTDSLPGTIRALSSAKATYEDPLTSEEIANTIKNGGAVVLGVNNEEWFGGPGGHEVVITGIQTNSDGSQSYLINDPWPPNQGKRLAVPVARLDAAMQGDGVLVTK